MFVGIFVWMKLEVDCGKINKNDYLMLIKNAIIKCLLIYLKLLLDNDIQYNSINQFYNKKIKATCS